MTKKSFFVILGLSVVVTYGMAFIEAIMNTSSNQAGLPFKFGSYTLFGEAGTNYLFLILDVGFWFIIIWGLRKVLLKITYKK